MKDLNKCEWYVGEYDRHKAEKILLQENIVSTIFLKTWDAGKFSWGKISVSCPQWLASFVVN